MPRKKMIDDLGDPSHNGIEERLTMATAPDVLSMRAADWRRIIILL
jgi:hypothetical protein